MNLKIENARASVAAPMESRPKGSPYAPMRIVPHGYGWRDDDDDAIDDLGSPEAPPPGASPTTLAQTEASAGAADDHQRQLSRVESGDDFTDDALAALAELEAGAAAYATDRVASMLRFGETLARAKKSLAHGKFSRWCKEKLQRKPSWCSAHRRLFEAGNDLEPAREWAAATGHLWAKCLSVERLLRVVGDFRRVKRGDSVAAPRRRREANEVIAELRQRLDEAEADFIALRDPLLPEEKARVAELAAAMGAADFAAENELATLARKRHWRLRDLVAQTCGAPQVSGTGVMDADKSTSDEGSTS